MELVYSCPHAYILMNKKYLKPCYVCKGSGKHYHYTCIECNGDGWVTKWFWKKQIIEKENNNLIAIERIQEQEKDDE